MEKIISPEEFFGFIPGSDRKMIRWEKLCEYYRTLEGASSRIKVTSPGLTSEGNEFLILYVSSEENIQNLEKYKDISKKLADPTDLSDREIDALVNEGRAVCFQDYGIHSNEVGGPQMVPIMLYDFLTAKEGDELYEALQNVIFIICPCGEPDGEIIFTDWYHKYLGTEYEGICSPYLRHNWAGHSNNRDAAREAIIESKYLKDILIREWRPQVFQDHHHQCPWEERMSIAPTSNPIFPYTSALVTRDACLYGAEMARALSIAGRRGVVSGDHFFSEYPITTFYSFMNLFNTVGMLTENADVSIATPLYNIPYDPTYEETYVRPPRTLTPTRECPDPYLGKEWHLYDIVEQMRIASEALVVAISKRCKDVLYGMAKKAKGQISRGFEDEEGVYLLPEKQNDPSALNLLLKLMNNNEIKIYRLKEDVAANGRLYPKGTYAVPLAQPYYAAVKLFLKIEPYNVKDSYRFENGIPSIGDTANTCIALDMGVNAEPSMCRIDEDLLERYVFAEYERKEFPLPANENFSYVYANKLLSEGKRLYRMPNGDFTDDAALGVEVCRARIGLLKLSLTSNEEEGFTRNLLRRSNCDYEVILDRQIRETDILDGFDVLIIPGDLKERLISGDAWDKKAPKEYQSGLGSSGKEKLIEFVKKGGRLIAWEKTNIYVNEVFDLKLKNMSEGLTRKEYSIYLSQIRAELCSKETFRGMPEVFGLTHNSAPIMIPTEDNIEVLAKFVDKDIYINGYTVGEERLLGTPCIINARYGEGNITLYAFNPEFRIQQDGTFKLLFNLFYNEI